MTKTYIYSDRQILAQHDIDDDAQPGQDDKYFYLHDRLGSVRLVIDDGGAVQNYYTYEPFGQTIESSGTLDNAFRFTGQYFDSEIEEYYLRARQYNPRIARFTSRDPVAPNRKKPLTHHRYLYCGNDSISNIDTLGLKYLPKPLHSDVDATREVTEAAVEFVRERGFPGGSIEAFSWRGLEFDYKFTDYTFQLTDNHIPAGSEYTNWLTGYTNTYLYGTIGNWGTRIGGHYHALTDPGMGHFDEPASRCFISGGALMGDEARYHETGSRMSNLDYVRAKFDLYYGVERMASADLTDPSFDRELGLFVSSWNSGSPRW